MRSHRFPIKFIFMGVVVRPRSDKIFDGRILLERVSKTHIIRKNTAHQYFSDDVIINSEIKAGKWKYL